VHALAVSGGFSARKVGEIDIIVAEMVTNLVKHAGGGDLLVKLIEEEGIQGLEIIAIDNGVGMTDVTRMVADGVSTKNTLGQGLGRHEAPCRYFPGLFTKGLGHGNPVPHFRRTASQIQEAVKSGNKNGHDPKGW
jgi:hypothetical protein